MWVVDECWCMLDVFKFCFKHEQYNIHWLALYCYSLYPYLMHFIVHWMNFLHACLICVMTVSRALYVSDLFQHWLEHLFDDWHILYPWSVNLFSPVTGSTWIQLIQYNTIQYKAQPKS
jgi:hypothetical protein